MIRDKVYCLLCQLFIFPLVRIFGPGPVLWACSKCLNPADWLAEENFIRSNEL